MDYNVNIDLYVIKRKHLNPNCIKLLHVKLFEEVDVEGSIGATIHFECIAISWKSYCGTSKPPRRLVCLSV
jgi:stage V sporulation protein SpoVS